MLLLCHPWNITRTQAVLVNAFDVLANRQTLNSSVRNSRKTSKLHEFIENGPLMLDSGASKNNLKSVSIRLKCSQIQIYLLYLTIPLPKSDNKRCKKIENT